VDDILVIFDYNHTNIQTILDDFNAIHPKLKFTAKMESNNTLNCLDITIHKTPTNWKTSIYRKPTFTEAIIPYTSHHPARHRYAAVKLLYNWLNAYDLRDEYKREKNIHNIMHKISFQIHPQKPPNHTPKNIS
jgi:hypothetical protein